MSISDNELIRELVTGGMDERAAKALLTRLSAASGGSQVVPGIVVEAIWNTDGTVASAGKYDAAGNFTAFVVGADTGVPWVRYEVGGLYVPITSVIGMMMQVTTTGAATPVVNMTSDGLFNFSVVTPPGNDNRASGHGVFYGCFPTWASLSGWQKLWPYVETGTAAITQILSEMVEIASGA